jgi:HAD superfamily hydrolase (TIGR01509 family)
VSKAPPAPSASSAPDAILFDLDGTLVDTERENVESVVLAARRWQAELSDEERAFIIGHSWNEIYAMIARNHGLELTMPELIAAAVDEKRDLMEVHGYRPLPGAAEAVRRLGRRSKLAIVSGSSCVEVRDTLAGLGMSDLFAVALGAEDYLRGKPAPDSYLLAMERLGAAPERSVAVEDATPGILAARAAGVRVIGVRAGNFAGYDLSPAHVVVDTLDEVTDELCARLLA